MTKLTSLPVSRRTDFWINLRGTPTPVVNIVFGERNKVSNVNIDANKIPLLILVGVLAGLLIISAVTYILSKGEINLLKELDNLFARIIETVSL